MESRVLKGRPSTIEAASEQRRRARPLRRSPDRTVSADQARVERPFGDATRMAFVQSSVDALAGTLVAKATGSAAVLSSLLPDYVRRPGKRVRPYLAVLGHDLASGRTTGERDPGVGTFAAALELLHAFLLVHDDIADRAATRRGLDALHVQLRPAPSEARTEGDRMRIGNDLAVVAGDWLYTASLQAMVDAPGLAPGPRLAAIASVLETCRETAEGQFNDIAASAEWLGAVDPSSVLDVYRLKTARYTFEGPLRAGALLAGGGPALLEALATYGTEAGIAFQLVDDLLGLFADEAVTGKPALADLREAKKTWPLLVAYKRGTFSERDYLAELFVRGDANGHDLRRVRSIVRSTGAFDDAIALLSDKCDRAMAALEPLDDGGPASRPVRELRGLVTSLLLQAESL